MASLLPRRQLARYSTTLKTGAKTGKCWVNADLCATSTRPEVGAPVRATAPQFRTTATRSSEQLSASKAIARYYPLCCYRRRAAISFPAVSHTTIPPTSPQNCCPLQPPLFGLRVKSEPTAGLYRLRIQQLFNRLLDARFTRQLTSAAPGFGPIGPYSSSHSTDSSIYCAVFHPAQCVLMALQLKGTHELVCQGPVTGLQL